MIDLHSHILPLVDDGATSWEMAEQMCAIALEDGITHMVASPHANSQFRYDREAYAERLAELQSRSHNKMKFSLGCDFHLSYENLELLFINPGEFLISGTKYLLIEFSDFSLPPRFEDLLFRMKTELQIVPILTHPERYPITQRNPQQVAPWVESGCLVQVTANSLTGHWGRKAKDVALWLLQRKLAHIIATDAHDTVHRPPVLSTARDFVSSKLGPEAASALVEANPRTIVENGPVTSLRWAPVQ
jgi:protein-tyrosine phosphatase